MIIAIIVSVIIVLFIGISFFVYRTAFYNGRRSDVTHNVLKGADYDRFHDQMTDLIDRAVAIPYEEAYTESYDGLRLFGRLYLQKEGAPFHIEFNGYKGNGIRDFSGGMQLALSQGDNVLLVDQRSHGRSEGVNITFGVKERRDVMSWIAFVLERFGRDTVIYLEGVSMGAATVLMASDLDLPENVVGIVADCPYSSPFGIISKVAKGMTGIDRITYPFIFLGALIFAHFNIFASSAVKSVANTKVPILLIHGTADHFVPIGMSREIRAARPDMVTLVEIDGAPHGLSYLQDYDAYSGAVIEFMAKAENDRAHTAPVGQ